MVIALVLLVALSEAREAGECWAVLPRGETPGTREEKNAESTVMDRAATVHEWPRFRVVENRRGVTSNCTRFVEGSVAARMRGIAFQIQCDQLPDYLTCDEFRELVRQAVTFAVAWINVAGPYDPPAAKLALVTGPDLTVRFDTLERPSLLGLATRDTVRLNLDANYGFVSVRNSSRAESTPVRDARAGPCTYDLRDVLLHEVFHSLAIGHCDDPDSLMWRYALPRRKLPAAYYPERTGGFHLAENDVYHLRRVWRRGNVMTMEERLDDGSFWTEYDRLRAGMMDTRSVRDLPALLRTINRHDTAERRRLLERVRDTFDAEAYAELILRKLALRRPYPDANWTWPYRDASELLENLAKITEQF